MKMRKGSVYDLGSCNFCDNGKLANNFSANLIYPYKIVFEVNGSFLRARFCSECLDAISDIKTRYDAIEVADTLTNN